MLFASDMKMEDFKTHRSNIQDFSLGPINKMERTENGNQSIFKILNALWVKGEEGEI
jgi:hypothetical protein